MLLLNIENLSDTELRYIARQEEIDGWDSLDRDDLIETIRDVFDDDLQFTQEGSDRHKFVKGITDINSDFLQLPGVDPLPLAYNNTSVHLVLRDYNWAYAFWSISINDSRKIEEQNAVIKLRLEGKKHSYDIEVNLEDTNWNVELPWSGETYVLKLLYVVNGTEELLATSNRITLNSIYFAKHPEELRDEKSRRLYIQPLISKEGSLISNKQVKEILSASEEAK